MQDETYRVVVHRARLDGSNRDPETYWLGLDETVTAVDAILGQNERLRTTDYVTLLTVAPLSGLPLSELIGEQLTFDAF